MRADIIGCTIINVVVAICFTVLAIVFHKWWIVLFAILLMFKTKEKGNTDE